MTALIFAALTFFHPTPDDVMAIADTHAPVPVLVTTETDDLVLMALMLQSIPEDLTEIRYDVPPPPPDYTPITERFETALPVVSIKTDLGSSQGHVVTYGETP